jgi:molybdopterin synthase catalytic subunit
MHILLFAQVKDAAGVAELDVRISGELTSSEVWNHIITARPELARFQKTTRLARNGEYADSQARFTDADEVALIPPVSGG